jgi:methylenetetrahydrofolate reductase (NADPH)
VLKLKLGKGGDFAVTQLFFDNRLYFDFVHRMREKGLDVPVVPGVLPVLNLAGLKRFLSFCGSAIPGKLLFDLELAQKEHGSEGVRAAGIEHAKKQVRELIEGGAPGVHLYTLNKADACLEIVGELKEQGVL